MKFAVAFLFLALASQCLANPVNDVFSDMVVDIVTLIKQDLAAQDPTSLPDFQAQQIQDDNVNFNLSLWNTKFSKASAMKVGEISTTGLVATVRVDFPELVLTSEYIISGTAYNRTIGGGGTVSVAFENVGQNFIVSVIHPDTELQIQTILLQCDVDSVKVTETGLNVEGMTEAEAAAALQEKLTAKIFEQKVRVGISSELLESKLDSLFNGKTLQEVAAEVKQLIHH